MAEAAGGVALVVQLDYDNALAQLAKFLQEVNVVEEGALKNSGQLKETLQGLQATAAELEVLIAKTNQFTTATEKAADVSADSNRAQTLAIRAQIKDAEYLNKTLDQRQQILSRISAALKGQSVTDLNKPQLDALNARYSNLAVNEYASGGLSQATLAQQNKAQQADALAQEQAYQNALRDLERRTQADIQADIIAGQSKIDAALQASEDFRKSTLTARLADERTANALEVQMARDLAAAQLEADRGILAERAEEEAQLARLIALEASRASAVASDGAYESANLKTKLKILQSIAAAEQASISRGTGTLSSNPTLANKFPAAALQDYSAVGGASRDTEALAKALNDTGKAAEAAAFGVKATAQEAREMSTILKDAVTGEFSRMAASVTRLLTLSGAFDGILGAVGLSVLGAAVAMGAFTVAALKGAEEENQFNAALALTNDYAGVTTAGLYDLAHAAAGTVGTIGNAKEAVLDLAASGHYTADAIGMISKTATDMAAATGQPVKTTIDLFNQLAKDPVEASAKLNEQYHFLTQSIFDQIQALTEHGQKTQAAALAEKTLSDAMETRTKIILDQQGAIERSWDGIKRKASEAWDAMLGIGRSTSDAQRLAVLTSDKAVAAQPGRHQAYTPDMENERATLQAKVDAENKAAIAKSAVDIQQQELVSEDQSYTKWKHTFDSNAQKRLKAVQDYQTQYAAKLALGLKGLPGGITPAQSAVDIANINRKYKDPRTPHVRVDTTPYNAAENQSKIDADNLKVQQNLLNLEKSMGLAVNETTYARVAGLAVTAEDSSYLAEQAKIQKQIANSLANKGDAGATQTLRDQLKLLQQQHTEKSAQLQLDAAEAQYARQIAAALTNITTTQTAAQSIISSINTLYGTTDAFNTNTLDNSIEHATVQKAQYDQAVQYQALLTSGADQETLGLARQANVLSLATQIYQVEQQRTKLLFDNATSVQDLYQSTYNSLEQQIQALEKARTTLPDSAASGLASGMVGANNALFQSFKTPQAADKFTLQNYTGTIGGSVYDSITQNLAKSMADSQLKGIQSLMTLGGAVSPQDTAKQKAQDDLALNTQSMADSLKVTVPALLQQMLDLMNGVTTPTNPVGNGILGNGTNNTQGSAASAAASDTSGSPSDAAMNAQISSVVSGASKSSDALKDMSQTGTSAFSVLGMTATQTSSLLYTGIVAATSGGKTAFKDFVLYATQQLLELWAVQKLVGLAANFATPAASTVQGNAISAAAMSADWRGSSYVGAPGYATGTGMSGIDSRGMVYGPGGENQDKVNVRLSPDEGVLNAAAMKYYGRDMVDRMNKLSMNARPGFADGGAVVAGPRDSSGNSGSGTTISIAVDASNSGGSAGTAQSGVNTAAQNGALQKQLTAAVLDVIQKNSTPGGPIYKIIKQTTR